MSAAKKDIHLTAVAGGIGSGKSVVCNILRALGYDVYDCDLRARTIMDNDSGLKERLACEFGAHVLHDNGAINRPVLSEIVFGDSARMAVLNSMVHGAVREDIRSWCIREDARRLFVETAILYQSGLDRMVTDIWEVTAPEETRIARVMRRNNLTADQVRTRIEAQSPFIPATHPPTYVIVNDGCTPLLPQILSLLQT